ncbi:MAG: PilZ domain-containing protein, partial [Elainellaceae cyanobacterium]
VNVMLLIAAILVAVEQPQLRQSHRLDRRLHTALISGETLLTGVTQDISETGAQVLLKDWPNLPDVVDVEIHGDTSAMVRLNGRVVRVAPRSDQETSVTITFENMTQTQRDGLVLVLYSDVEEWYSQFRTNADKPLQSIRFLIASLVRAFREPKASQPTPVFKLVKEVVQVYSQGQFLTGTAYAINSRRLKIALQEDQNLVLHPEVFGQGEPVGLLMGNHGHPPVRLVAQLDQVYQAEEVTHVEISFPKVLDVRQGDRIEHLMYSLHP